MKTALYTVHDSPTESSRDLIIPFPVPACIKKSECFPVHFLEIT